MMNTTVVFCFVILLICLHSINGEKVDNYGRGSVSLDTVSGVLQAHLTWTSSGSHTNLTNFLAQWQRVTCDSDSTWYTCPPSGMMLSLVVYVLPSVDKTTVMLPGVAYNSKYQFNMFRLVKGSARLVQSLQFYTSTCSEPDATFTVCHDDDKAINHVVAQKMTSSQQYSSSFKYAVGASVGLIIMCLLLAVILVCHHSKSRGNLKGIIKVLKGKSPHTTHEDIQCAIGEDMDIFVRHTNMGITPIRQTTSV